MISPAKAFLYKWASVQLLLENQRGKIVLSRFLPAYLLNVPLCLEQIFPAAQTASVLVAHGASVGPNVVNGQYVPWLQLRQHPVLCEFIRVFADGAHHVPGMALGAALLSGHGNVMVRPI